MKKISVGILGSGTIGRYVLDAIVNGEVENASVEVVCGRSDKSRGKDRVQSLNIPWITDAKELLNYGLDVVVEAASHDALEKYGHMILGSGISLIPMSLGALVDGELLDSLIRVAEENNSVLYVPSGGIGALDAIQAAKCSHINKVTMTTRKPPQAWKGIEVVEAMDIDLDTLTEPVTLFEGTAGDCVKDYPQNINIAAALSLAGIGFDKTIIKMVADPNTKSNTHEIHVSAESGNIDVRLENVPMVENPKTALLACLSAVAAIKRFKSCYHIGT